MIWPNRFLHLGSASLSCQWAVPGSERLLCMQSACEPGSGRRGYQDHASELGAEGAAVLCGLLTTSVVGVTLVSPLTWRTPLKGPGTCRGLCHAGGWGRSRGQPESLIESKCCRCVQQPGQRRCGHGAAVIFHVESHHCSKSVCQPCPLHTLVSGEEARCTQQTFKLAS